MNNNFPDNKIKIGILGGTFNPIHLGHLILAQNAAEYCDLDKVLIIPSGISYFKNQAEIVSKKDRINMVNLSIEDNPLFEISTIETEKEGNSYTYETILELQNNHINCEFFYIIGADTLYSIDSWKNPEIIFDNTTLICSVRDGNSIEDLENQKSFLINKYNAKIILMDTPEVQISSTSIRRLLKENKSCKYYLHDKCIQYIKENKLYME